MAANPTPTNDSELLADCTRLIAGCRALEEEIGIKQNTAAVMEAVSDAAQTARMEVGRLKAERGQRRVELRAADREGEKVLGRCRLRLAAIFGGAYNVQWEAAGFKDRSTMVPEVFAKRLMLLERLSLYLAANPAQGSVDMGTTSVICHATYEALSDARSAVNRNKSVLAAAVKAKNASFAKLRLRMRGLIKELDMLLAGDDPRWLAFGLNRPASLSMPRPVKRLTLTALGLGNVEVRWANAPHATRYRVQMRVTGADEFEAVATVHEPSALLRGLVPGQSIDVRVIAANQMDETSPSQVVTVMVQ